jgi:hypothetical protein
MAGIGFTDEGVSSATRMIEAFALSHCRKKKGQFRASDKVEGDIRALTTPQLHSRG